MDVKNAYLNAKLTKEIYMEQPPGFTTPECEYSVCHLLMVLLLRVSALHYLAGDRVMEGFWTVASAHALHQPTIAGPSISRIAVHKFRT